MGIVKGNSTKADGTEQVVKGGEEQGRDLFHSVQTTFQFNMAS